MSSKTSRPLDGWITKYKINRRIDKSESRLEVDQEMPDTLLLCDNGALKVNSVYIEYIDRYFFLRGWVAIGLLPVGLFTLWASVRFLLLINEPFNDGTFPTLKEAMLPLVFSCVFFVMFLWVLKNALLREFFCYTHYPIRFNRITRKVYVFRHNGPGGVLEVDWEKAYWFAGGFREGSSLAYDLRCHVLDADGIIRHTFAVGHFSPTRAETLQHWEMIRRYMEESPAALPFPPLHLFICTEPTLWNAFATQLGAVNAGKSLLLLAFGSIWGFFRWVSQKTCRTPRWPAEVEAVCQIPPDDPYRQPEPWRIGQILGMTEEEEQRSTEYILQAKAAAQDYERANPGSSGL